MTLVRRIEFGLATPGPWEAVRGDAGHLFIRPREHTSGRGGLAVAQIHRRGQEKIANGNLIAASLDLANAARYYLDLNGEECGCFVGFRCVCCTFRAAIAKAEGR